MVLPGFDAGAARDFARRLAATLPGLTVGSAAAEPDGPPRGPAGLIADAEASAAFGRRPILVVEDEPELAQVMEAFLGALGGHDVVVAHDAREALRRCRESAPALALIDLELPDLDGRELLRQLREIAPDVLGVACSGKRPESAAGAGFTAFYRKPFEMRRLTAEIARLLSSQGVGAP
jgi:two-component system sensor histidine kinase TorS